MICKNEELNLPKLLDSVAAHVDEIVIADTGSTDKTKEVAQRYGARVADCNATTHPQFFFMDDEATLGPYGYHGPFSDQMTLANFGEVRNFSLRMATGDYVLWLDADDILEGGQNLRHLVAQMAIGGKTAAWMLYNYGFDHGGRVICRLWRERIVKRGTASWVNPVHEVLAPIDQATSAKVENIVVNHHRPAERTAVVANRNYKILVQHIKKHPEDARTLFYFGNEARFINQEQAITAYEKYTELSGWAEERAIARAYLGELYESKQRPGAAYTQYAAATVERGDLPEGWYGLARLAYNRQDWAECARYCEETIKRGNPDTIIMINPISRTYAPYLIYNVALNHLGRVKEALEACEKGLAVVPDDPHLLHNRQAYVKFLDQKADPVRQLLENPSVPARIKYAVTRATAEGMIPPPKIAAPEGKLSIVLWTGPAVEPWKPSSPNTTGLGGSETAAIEMAKHLTKLGHKVLVYSDCALMEGNYDGVEYHHYSEFNGCECDVFISSRQPNAVDHPVKAKLKLLWVHDIHCGQPSPQMHKWLLGFDRIMCLSEWHKGYFRSVYPHIHPDTIVVTRNGIDAARFAGEVPQKKNKLVFPSSANRGLDIMLALFPRIKEQVPDVELHVFYGFETWERTAMMMGNKPELEQIAWYRKRLSEIPGVVWRGRVNQQTLAQEMMESKVWSYPTAFTETSCITALEAQASECVPVTSNLAALSETVKWGIRIDGSNMDQAYHQVFVDQVVQLLRDDEKRMAVAKLGREWALQFTWEALAVDWAEMFEQLIATMEDERVPRYEPMLRAA